MRTKAKIISITLFAVIAITSITTVTFLMLDGKSKSAEKDFSYISPEVLKSDEVIDYPLSSLNLSEKDLSNFSESGMKLIQTTYGPRKNGISTTYFDFDNNIINYDKVYNLSNTSYLTPYYLDGHLEGMISGAKSEDESNLLINWEKSERKEFFSEITKYDHEISKFKNHYYILNGNKIWVGDGQKELKKFQVTPGMLGFPLAEDLDGERVSSPDGYHFNSFDIYGSNLLLNSRDYGTIFSLNILDESGDLKEKNDWKLNWVLCGNSITPWYIDSNYNEDGTWENPIISTGTDYSETYWNFEENPEYVPEVFSQWEDKLLKIEIDGTVYDFTDINQAKEFNLISNDHKFWGEHTIRVINKYLDSVSETLENYDPEKLYISIHDNHFPSDDVYKYWYDEPDKYGVSWGDDPYSFHANTEKTKDIFGDNPYQIEDEKSFTKVYEIDAENMIAKEVLNRENTVSSEINQFSDYRSSSTFFSINGQSYLVTESSMNSSFALVAFDGYDSDTNSLINERVLMDIQWKGDAGGYIHYRTYPIFTNVENVEYGWNTMSENPYIG